MGRILTFKRRCVTMPPMPRKMQTKLDFSAGCVVWDASKKKVLLIRVENLSGEKVWTFPKGHPDAGETVQQAALREVREETGWNCTVKQAITQVHYNYSRDKVLYKKTVEWFLMLPVE